MKKLRLAIIVSQFNKEITNGLLQGALRYLKSQSIESKKIKIINAPGAFEIPLIAKRLAQSKKFDGVICLGAVIKGDTAHFEFISLATSIGIMHTMLKAEIPISFGILTTYDESQAKNRSRNTGKMASHNKGIEAAKACVETINLLRSKLF